MKVDGNIVALPRLLKRLGVDRPGESDLSTVRARLAAVSESVLKTVAKSEGLRHDRVKEVLSLLSQRPLDRHAKLLKNLYLGQHDGISAQTIPTHRKFTDLAVSLLHHLGVVKSESAGLGRRQSVGSFMIDRQRMLELWPWLEKERMVTSKARLTPFHLVAAAQHILGKSLHEDEENKLATLGRGDFSRIGIQVSSGALNHLQKAHTAELALKEPYANIRKVEARLGAWREIDPSKITLENLRGVGLAEKEIISLKQRRACEEAFSLEQYVPRFRRAHGRPRSRL